MFDNDMMLYRKLELWSKESDLWSKSFQTFIADRRFDIAYNSILLVFRTDCLFSEKEKKTYINRILHHPDVIEAVSLADTQKYAHWITFCIRHKLGYMLILAAFFKRLLIKELV